MLIEPDWIVLAAGVVFVLGYLVINQVALRLMLMLGTCLYIWYYAVAAGDPLWVAIATSVAMGTANLIGLAQIFYRRSNWAIPKEHLDIYPRFETLPPGDFRDLMASCHRYVSDQDVQITTESDPVDRLYYVLSGGLKATKKGQGFSLPAGIFVGEVAYLTSRNSSATILLEKGSEVLEWDVAELRKRAKRNSRFRLALEALISNDLAEKVSVAVAPKDYVHAQKY